MPLIHGERDPLLDCRPVVQVPAPFTADEARQILADARPWVPLVTRPTAVHLGKRVRIVYSGGQVEGVLGTLIGTTPVQFSLVGMPKRWDPSSGQWFIHPDDVPNPDADLIDGLARSLAEAWRSTASWAGSDGSDVFFDDLARKTIERVRAGA